MNIRVKYITQNYETLFAFDGKTALYRNLISNKFEH